MSDHSAFRSFSQIGDANTIAQAAVDAAQQAVVSSQKGVQAGTRTTVDVLNAVQRVAETTQTLYQARYEYLVNRIRLAAAAGELNDELFAELNTAFIER